jgi:hypothetical protein
MPKQNRANENKHGAYRQHIELQGKVHAASLVVDEQKLAQNAKARRYWGAGCPVPRKEKPSRSDTVIHPKKVTIQSIWRPGDAASSRYSNVGETS